jgi:hypothetical protein
MSLYQFYRSKDWEDLLQILKAERVNEEGFIICAECGKPIVKAYDCIGHHIIELTEENYLDCNISLNPENIALVHHRCHNRIHNKLGYIQRQVFIVYGSPLSGKTSYVNEVMAEGDLIVDMDNIWQCVSGCDRYTKPPRLKSIVFGLRDKLLEDIKFRRGKWNNAYIIGGYPYTMDRDRLVDTLGARAVFIDTDKATCLQRLADCTDRDHNEWSRYIDDWWLQYEGGF